MYSKDFKTYVSVENTDNITREGAARPGFFRGVATVCSKLFNIIGPNKVYFGQKDGIQCMVIRRMVSDLNFPFDVVIVPTIRENDGLAMSSRNSYLSEEERKIAPTLYKALTRAKEHFDNKERQSSTLVRIAKEVIESNPKLKLDYLSIADLDNGNEIETIGNQGAMLSTAVWLGKTRLIDNIILK
eukprot:TRINITY_DN4312_c0_g1_i1.p1 TRINITY_DN4312_c0_g1~~TRINITY_DN4312_c0_g1_i1.p1  ORF type:complete len:186 (+),score=60.83 TRINITY_DN4312_c0_g1_i1:524-1081(+)